MSYTLLFCNCFLDAACACISKLGFNLSDAIFGGPFSVRVTAGEFAVFTCTVPCTDAITWFATKHSHVARQSVSALTNHTKVVSQCTNDEVYTEALIIIATVDINTTLLQCAVMNFDVCRNAAECKLRSRICFSRFAAITGKVDSLLFTTYLDIITVNCYVKHEQETAVCIASFSSLPRFQFWIACSMFLHTASYQKLEPGKAWE